MIRVSILGATGYTGGELLRLLLNHPGVAIQHVTSESSAGRPVSSTHPDLRGRIQLKYEKLKPSLIAKDTDVVFSCLPAGVGIKPNARFVKAGLKVIDISADFRLPSASLFKTWYKQTHSAPHLLKSRVYGLPEVFRKTIAQASLIANPGCYATAALLAAAPLIKAKVVDPKSFIVDAKSGLSGAGKKVAPGVIFSEINENLQTYNVAAHRHQPEIETVLKSIGPAAIQLTFVPHLIPMNRGILSVLYATLKKPTKTGAIQSLFAETYEHEPFVRVLPEGENPRTKNVVRTNYCDIGVFQDSRSRRIIVVSAIDNLGKGAASQAVQNMNLLCNRSETEGLL